MVAQFCTHVFKTPITLLVYNRASDVFFMFNSSSQCYSLSGVQIKDALLIDAYLFAITVSVMLFLNSSHCLCTSNCNVIMLCITSA